MKLLFLTLLLLIGFNSSVFACRTNTDKVRHRLGVYAIQQAYELEKNSLVDLTGIRALSTQMFWVETEERTDCPDKFIVNFELEYNNCLSYVAKVESFKNEKSVTIEKTAHCDSAQRD